jgi:hypothetical protein
MNIAAAPLLITEIPLELHGGRGRLGFWRLGLSCDGRRAFGLQQRINQAPALSERLAQLSPPAIAGVDDLAQRHRLAGQLLADGAAEEAIA